MAAAVKALPSAASDVAGSPPYARYADIVYQRSFWPIPGSWRALYVGNHNDQPDLWTVHLRSGARTPVTRFDSRAVRCYWLADDGQTVVMQVDPGTEQPELRITRIDRPEPEIRALRLPGGRRLVAGGSAGFLPGTAGLALCTTRPGGPGTEICRLDVRSETVDVLWHGRATLVPVAVHRRRHGLILRGSSSNLDSNLYHLDLDSGGLRPLTEDGPGTVDVLGPRFSGRRLWVVTDRDAEFSYLAALDLGSRRLEAVFRPESDVDFALPLPDGRFLCCVNQEGWSGLVTVDVESARAERCPCPRGVATEGFVARLPDGGIRIGLGLATPGHPPDLVVSRFGVTAGPWRTVARARRSPPPNKAIGPRAETLAGVPSLIYRPSRGTAQPCPVLVSFHGGPEAQERPTFAYNGLYQALLARGIAVVAPNVAGSTGYGRSHRLPIYGDWGGIDVDDAGRVLGALNELPWCKGSARALFGVSYGGFLALSAGCRLPDAGIVAVVALNAPTNLAALFDELPLRWRSFARSWIGDQTDRSALRARSPLWQLTPASPPTLLIHGGFDARVPVGQSIRFHERARRMGVGSQLIVAAGGHGLTRGDQWRSAFSQVTEYVSAALLGTSGD